MLNKPMELLDPAKTNTKLQYCIPLWLRDEQIKLANARLGKDGKPLPRFQPIETRRTDPIAVVCFGASLKTTWEEIKKFKYVISGSGSHKFLIDHGIVPTHHVDVDPREHKVKLLGTPHPDVEYLIASACHPKLFDHLADFRVTLWHIYDTGDEGYRLLPPGEWAVTGGSNVGLRQLTLSAMLGFRDLHVFGMDGCGIHAAAHPNEPPKGQMVEWGGKMYPTTPVFLECAKQTFHELNQMENVTAKFYGDGLVQAMAKSYKPKHNKGALVGIKKPELISGNYADLNRQLHRDNLAYGVGGEKHVKSVIHLVGVLQKNMKTPPSVLDYGCGKGRLGKALPFPIWEYDPAVPGKEESPRAADLVVCSDVLEHIEPEKLGPVLEDLQRCVKQLGFFVIATGPASKTLADGRNAHLIQKGAGWWQTKLEKFFLIPEGGVKEKTGLVQVIVFPGKKLKSKLRTSAPIAPPVTNTDKTALATCQASRLAACAAKAP